MSRHKLAIFDIDGTIAVRGVMPESILAGMRRLHELDFLTTVSTGRGYVRAKDVLGEAFEEVIAPGSLIMLEHGTKVSDRDGNVVQADYFKPNELDHIVDFLRSNKDMVRILWFVLPAPDARVQIWCKLPEDVPIETERRGYYADVFTCPFEELRERFAAFPLSCVSARLESFITVDNLKLHFTRSDLDVLFFEGMMEFVRNSAGKSKAVLYLERHFGVPVSGMILAGNAINDVDMLNLPAGRRILVGEGAATDIVLGHLREHDEVIRIASPEKLGEYLQGLES